jgi:polysaccharide biosynthesis transport protein
MLTTDHGNSLLPRVAETRSGQVLQGRPPSSHGALETWELLWRYRRLLTIILALGALASVVIAMSLRPIFTATSVIVFDRNDSRPYEAVVEAQRQERDRSTMETELDVIRSRVFLGVVVDALNLAKDPFYNTYLPPPTPVAEDWLHDRVNWLVRKATRRNDAEQLKRARNINQNAQRDRAISKLLENFAVDRKGESLALSIKVDQASPQRAAEIADALARHYVAWTSRLKEVATTNTVNYLQKQANDLAVTIANKEREIAGFTSESGLTFDPKDDLLRARTEQLNEQLTLARVDEAGAWAKVNEAKQRLQDKGQADIGKVFTSELLTNLRMEEGRLQRLRGQLTSKFGDSHPLVVDADAELSSNRKMIADEAARLVAELENAGEIATLKVKKFQDEVASLQEQLKGRNLAEIKRRELERDLLSDQKRHDTIVLRLNLLNPEEEEVKPTAMIASFAEVPVEQSFPKPIFIVLAGLVGSALVAVLIVVIADALDNRVYKPSDLEELTGRPNIIHLPYFRQGGRSARDFHRSVLRQPDSTFAKAIRSLCLAWRTIDGSPGGKVLMITSAAPGDGKTTISLAMAATTKANGMRSVVVDLNPSPRGAGALCGFTHSGVIEEITSVDWEGFNGLVKVSPSHPFLDMVVVRLALQDYGRLFDMLRKSYDLVIIDTAATSVSEDAVWLSSYVDSVLLVVRSGRTKEKQILEIVQRFNFDSASLIGSVMNFYGKPPLLRRNERQGWWNRLWPRRNYA